MTSISKQDDPDHQNILIFEKKWKVVIAKR
jgi:hypothetical protein